MTKNENQEMPEINRKFFNNKNHPLLAVTVTRKMLKKTRNFVSKYILASRTPKTTFKLHC